MSSPPPKSGPGRIRLLLPVLLTVAIVAAAVADEVAQLSQRAVEVLAEEDLASDDKLRVTWVEPATVAPGIALRVRVGGLSEQGEPSVEVGKLPAEVLHREGSQLVIQLPRELPEGVVKLRVFQADRKSKPRLLQVQPLSQFRVLRYLLGGLALFVLGLRTLGRALRAYVGQQLREVLARLTRSPLRSMALGCGLGAVTQSTTSAAAVLVGLMDARMLGTRRAVAVLLGGQLGATVVGVLLPLLARTEGLFVVAVGVLWLILAQSRRSRALSKMVLGLGLLFLGLRLMRMGFEPLVADPYLLPYLGGLEQPNVTARLLVALLGVVLAALLQGPGPVFALTLSLAQSTGLMGLSLGLCLLAGTSFGAAAGTLAVGSAYGRRGRILWVGHALFGLLMTAVALAGVPLWVAVSEAVLAGDPSVADYSRRALYPHVGLHLGVGFVVSQAVATLVALLAYPSGIRLSRRLGARGLNEERPPTVAEAGVTRAVERALGLFQAATQGVHEVVVTGVRARSVDVERSLREAGAVLESALESQGEGRAGQGAAAALACFHLQTTIHHALHHAEEAAAQNLRLEPAHRAPLQSMCDAIVEGYGALRRGLTSGDAPSREQAQSREIRVNALEAETRRSLLRGEDQALGPVAYRLWLSEMLLAYESLGNQLYRVALALTEDSEDEF